MQSVQIAEEEMLRQKPLHPNGFIAFFQKAWRAWQGVWYGFSEKHPKLSSLAYMVFFFLVFSMGVTVWQYIVMTVLLYAFAGLADVAFVWPEVHFTVNGTDLVYAIFNEPAEQLADGSWDPTGGLGNFIAYEIAVFTAQCINLPLQRNITYRSHGNPWWQAMWYFIGWIGVSFFTSALWGIVVPFVRDLWGWDAAVYNLIKTFITGGVSMFIFFFIFLIIFPDVKKTETAKKAKLERAERALGRAKWTAAQAEMKRKYEKALLAYTVAAENRKVFDAEKALASVRSLAEAKINAYWGMIKKRTETEKLLQDARMRGDAAAVERAQQQLAETECAVAKIKEIALKADAARVLRTDIF